MKKKEIKIIAPEGFHFTGEVTNTEEGNTIAVVFEEDKPKEITWKDIISDSKVFRNLDTDTLKTAKLGYYTGNTFLESIKNSHNYGVAHAKLTVIAEYFNGDWRPISINNEIESGAYGVIKLGNGITSESWGGACPRAGLILFKDLQSCEKAIRIMGDELEYLFNY